MFLAFLLGAAVCFATGVEDVRQRDSTVSCSVERTDKGRVLDRIRSATDRLEGSTASQPTPADPTRELGDIDADSVLEIEIMPVDESGCRSNDGFWYPGKNLDKAAGVVVKQAERGFDFLWLLVISIVALPVLIFFAILVMIFRK